MKKSRGAREREKTWKTFKLVIFIALAIFIYTKIILLGNRNRQNRASDAYTIKSRPVFSKSYETGQVIRTPNRNQDLSQKLRKNFSRQHKPKVRKTRNINRRTRRTKYEMPGWPESRSRNVSDYVDFEGNDSILVPWHKTVPEKFGNEAMNC